MHLSIIIIIIIGSGKKELSENEKIQYYYMEKTKNGKSKKTTMSRVHGELRVETGAVRGLLGSLLQEAEEGKEVHQGRLRVEREEGEVRGLRQTEEIQKVQKGGLQV